MSLYLKILQTYPELTDADFLQPNGAIHLKDDGDGIVYIKKWDYKNSLPGNLSIGK